MLGKAAVLTVGALVALGSARVEAKGPVDPVLDLTTGFGSVWAPSGRPVHGGAVR